MGKELQAITGETGAGIIRAGNHTFVVVEIESEAVTAAGEAYLVTDPEEAADLKDAMEDDDNPTYTTNEAMTYLRALRAKRRGQRIVLVQMGRAEPYKVFYRALPDQGIAEIRRVRHPRQRSLKRM